MRRLVICALTAVTVFAVSTVAFPRMEDESDSPPELYEYRPPVQLPTSAGGYEPNSPDHSSADIFFPPFNILNLPYDKYHKPTSFDPKIVWITKAVQLLKEKQDRIGVPGETKTDYTKVDDIENYPDAKVYTDEKIRFSDRAFVESKTPDFADYDPNARIEITYDYLSGPDYEDKNIDSKTIVQNNNGTENFNESRLGFTPKNQQYYMSDFKSAVAKDKGGEQPEVPRENNRSDKVEPVFQDMPQRRQNPNKGKTPIEDQHAKAMESHAVARARNAAVAGGDVHQIHIAEDDSDSRSLYAIAVFTAMGAALSIATIGIGIGLYNMSKRAKAAADVDYPAYGVTGPTMDTSGDRKLAQSAHMYHYQHQKQQIIAMERGTIEDNNGSISDAESEEENEEGDYTVYECPGFATTGDMEVENPLFDEPTPATPGGTVVPSPTIVVDSDVD